MSYTDIIKKSVLESFASTDMSPSYVGVVLLETFIIALYIFLIYRYMTRTTFYSKSFAVSMSIISLITAGIILAMQSNIVISLGMVGALSIVRFRTAIKEPMDLLFLFWSIGTGIVVGAGLFSVAVVMAVFVTIGIVVLNLIPTMKSPELLIIKRENDDEDEIENIIKSYSKKYKIDSRSISNGVTTYVIEVSAVDGGAMVKKIAALSGVTLATLMRHEGEVKN
ncbi:MAG: DUF4956 domain-containing protein [Pseudobutyrivibrio ruminis]|uniref:DUF4956 domain-containing protein n=1 Tax=Pseudobutyrivibrio ruminis TaxID=46206 RepID=UPI0026F1349A|nr:DUF4956 domain-containing protein [Pseudobutyrivibrio ruminis]MBE5912953.1 DUF4956 domain-containing protein [Pseudobutyrivibrio ruminis]